MARWRFVHITDIHVGSPRSFRYAPAWVDNWKTARRQIESLEPDLLLIGGDLTRDGFLHDFEFAAVRDELTSLPFPVHVIPGNMDCGNKLARVPGASGDPTRSADPELNLSAARLERFEHHFGPLAWTFVHRDVRFTGFPAVLVGSGLPQERQVERLMSVLPTLPRTRQHIVMTHYPLFLHDVEEGEFDLEAGGDAYQHWYFGIDPVPRARILDVFERAGVTAALSGHVHVRTTDAARGITFYRGPSSAFPQHAIRWGSGDPTLGFQCFEVDGDALRYGFVPLDHVSDREGYGPPGHPAAAHRDYSAAWGSDPELGAGAAAVRGRAGPDRRSGS